MTNIDKLKAAAAKAVDNFDPNMFVETRDVLALLDELKSAEKLIAELEAREINLPPYSFFDFKQGSPFKSGAYCHIDSVNQELSKHGIKITAAAGKGEAS